MSDRSWVSGSVLKWAAVLTMLADHLGASLLEAWMLDYWGGSRLGEYFSGQGQMIHQIDQVLRWIGRPAFPIFCFLLVEGFLHTRSVRRYAVRLGSFALISEIPFDLSLWTRWMEPEHQNVFFTLLIGLLVIWGIRSSGDRLWAGVLCICLGCASAQLLHTDYGSFGVALIVLLYLLKERRGLQCLAGALACAWEITAPLAFVLIYFYNGQRGRQPRWLFYWIYPAQFLLYYLIGAWLLPLALL